MCAHQDQADHVLTAMSSLLRGVLMQWLCVLARQG
jgi:hypothetical protein